MRSPGEAGWEKAAGRSRRRGGLVGKVPRGSLPCALPAPALLGAGRRKPEPGEKAPRSRASRPLPPALRGAPCAMLPWRRSKFVLVEGERPGKGKSLGPGLSYASLLSGLVRSCPDLLPQCPLGRLGGVFRSKRQKVELNRDDPSYTVWYLGNAVTLQAKGEGCTEEAVEKIWAKSDYGASGTKMRLTLGPHGIRMSPSAEKGARRPGHAYLLHRITCCVADRRHPKVFSWVYRHQVKNKAVVLRCHAVLVSKAEKARAMALLLYQTSRSAFNEFKRLKKQNDARRLQQQLLGEAIVPWVPLRKLLNCKCPYRPPPERNRSAPRLSAIREEEEEDESGGKEDKGPGAPRGSSHGGVDGTAADSIVGACREHGVRSVRGRPDGASPRGQTATSLASKTGKGRERSEVLTLARELRVCTLRSPLPRLDTSAWEDPVKLSCLPS
ncbi:protein FAM43B [Paroedura picta]|uniref:protein FAM43B n=1 Tax=Paroedura picta TaxID=143630 RepID=UPI004055AF42